MGSKNRTRQNRTFTKSDQNRFENSQVKSAMARHRQNIARIAKLPYLLSELKKMSFFVR